MLSENKIEGILEDLPTFSQSALRIIALANEIDCPSKELVQQITNDPILTTKVLKLVNSAFFGLSREIESIQQSVVYVGINTIKNLAISVAAMGALPKTNHAGLNMDQFWLHSLITATVAKLIAQERNVNKTEVSTYFIAGLLHDIGQIILSQSEPEEYRQILEQAKKEEDTLCSLEEAAFGINHAYLGALLAEKWQLPDSIVTAIRHHHDPAVTEGNEMLRNSLFVGGIICKTLEEAGTRLGQIDEITTPVQEWLGQPLPEVIASLSTLEDEIDNARIFIQ